ncbi:BZ3500_MvSof-1268-A1-R1_Chr3-1g05919 [Microbotryum saponariae]|uniref:BZ3500_MvSof-1268-A1-R1_Chr3-1g05919 protein n=1 Tax=Microbotryum saponariae TaxID=289078 RepID=A0A2X0LGV9_9BASI|nr:BZ3500_MvSof-1268-A1-R1_Chr3-1g05919 [Microbotryum saponariae]SDA05109.1 BZ3501_MvSof-1269-A2-R1_Chr3-1g05589 [Microbotryum saponariae]
MQSLGHDNALITLWVSSPDTHSERRFALDLTIADLKDKLERVSGISSSVQVLSLQRTATGTGHSGQVPQGQTVVAQLNEDHKTLAQYGAQEWMTIRVDSSDAHGKSQSSLFTDTSLVEKFELTNQEYEARSGAPFPRGHARDTVLAFKQRHQLGRFAPTVDSSHELVASQRTQLPVNLIPGARCEVALSDVLSRRGTVRFLGPTQFGPQDETVWVGIEWDEPVGKNDGSVDGVKYFEAKPLRASFVRPDKVTVGNFPEVDPFADDDLEGEEM